MIQKGIVIVHKVFDCKAFGVQYTDCLSKTKMKLRFELSALIDLCDLKVVSALVARQQAIMPHPFWQIRMVDGSVMIELVKVSNPRPLKEKEKHKSY